jgi:hemolysin activation/secretion protein
VLVRHAQALLVARGYVTSRVLLEPQDLRTGSLTLRVLVGRLGRVRAHPASDAAAHLGNALALREGEPLNLRDIEQTLENLQRLPSVTADIDIVPADEGAMTSDLVVRWQQRMPWRLSLSLDDAGSPATGRYQGTVTLSRDHALGRNDLLYLTLQRGLGDSAGGTHGATLHYSLPLGRHTLAFTVSTYQYEQAVTGAFQRYVYAGKGETQELSLTRLLHRDAASATRAQLGIGTRASRNFIDDTEVAVQRRQTSHWSLALLHDARVGANELKASLTHRQGMRALGAHQAPEAAFNEGSAFARWWQAEANWQGPLGSLPGRWRLSSGLRTQWHDTRLTAPDRFAIGSRYTVRGFGSETLLSGDSGWVWRHELSGALMDGPLQAYLGLDRGCVSGPAAQVLPGRCLTGAALGLRGTHGPWSADVFMAWPLRHPDTLRPAHATAGFQLFAQF